MLLEMQMPPGSANASRRAAIQMEAELPKLNAMLNEMRDAARATESHAQNDGVGRGNHEAIRGGFAGGQTRDRALC